MRNTLQFIFRDLFPRLLLTGFIASGLVFTSLIASMQANADEEIKLRDLKYGTILFDYYQQNYFASLIGYEVANSRGELNHQINEALLLNGGMTLSYGLPDDAESIFKKLLGVKGADANTEKPDINITDEVRNKAWFYLAKMYYHKGEGKKAAVTLGYIHGDIPSDIQNEFNYLETHINIHKNNHKLPLKHI